MPAPKKKPLAKAVVRGNNGVKVSRACTINKPAAELYAFWRTLSNLPKFMRNIVSVVETSDTESHWVIKGPGNQTWEHDAVIINDKPVSMIAWRSREGAEVPNAGSIHFEPVPTGEGTQVTVTLEYVPPVGKLGVIVAKMMGDEPGQQVAEDLRRFKAMMECGEVPTTEGQSHGAGPRTGGRTL